MFKNRDERKLSVADLELDIRSLSNVPAGSDGQIALVTDQGADKKIFVRVDGTLKSVNEAPATTGNNGYAAIEISGTPAFRPIKQSYIVPNFAITAFSTVSASQEIGITVTSPVFTAAYNYTPTSASVIDNQGNPSLNVISTPTNFTYPHSYTKTANNATVGFTLTAAEGVDSNSRGTNITWYPKGFWGVGLVGIDTQVEMETLASQPLIGARALTFTVNPGVGQYIYYCYPTAYGTGTFFVGGFEGGFSLMTTISVTRNGVTQNYYIYRSDNDNLGSTTVQVT